MCHRFLSRKSYLTARAGFFVAHKPVTCHFSVKGPIDAYCIHCGDRSLFSCPTQRQVFPHQIVVITDRYFTIDLACGRDIKHEYFFLFQISNSVITKIGQYPSVADLSNAQLIKYRKILGSERYREFNRAVGLAAHGVGIGSFVYLRRILESLIEEAHQQAKGIANWDEEKYAQSRVTEKIELLKGQLPDFMVRNRLIYGILSKGVHELSEEECLRYFMPLKSVIELILNEHLIAIEYQKSLEEAERGIADIHKELSESL